jgi:hypothetical protein
MLALVLVLVLVLVLAICCDALGDLRPRSAGACRFNDSQHRHLSVERPSI